MLNRIVFSCSIAYILFAAWWVISSGFQHNNGTIELLNVACDPTREMWRDLNDHFIRQYATETGTTISIRQSHGGSGSQARAVIDGLDADIATLALWTDTDAIRKAGRIDPDWENRFPNRSLPFVSTIVIVVRKGNPKGITDWSDLARSDVNVITPNPKTSGNGKWSFLALWGSVVARGGSDSEAKDFVRKVYRNVPILDQSARGSTMTFSQKHIGDAHLTWENEAHLEIQESQGQLEIVYPKMSVLAEPHVAIVDAVVRQKGTENIAQAYVQSLYTTEAQRIIARHYYRPVNPEVIAETAKQFPTIEWYRPLSIETNWETIHKRFFAEGGLFDELFSERSVK